jgi:hypothetical protein
MIGLQQLTFDRWAWRRQCDAEVLPVRLCKATAWSDHHSATTSMRHSLGSDSHLRTVTEARDGTDFGTAGHFGASETIQYP